MVGSMSALDERVAGPGGQTHAPSLQRAAPHHAGPLGEMLARAFHDDPVQRWLFPRAGDQARYSPRMFRASVRLWARFGWVATTTDLSGAAVWVPPGPPRPSRLAGLRMALDAVRALRSRTLLAGRGFARIERHHPREPHWYLMALGTEPERQGTGVGSALLRPVLERCDREGIVAWLESSKWSNVPFYQRRGFELVSELVLPEDGPSLWLMRRDPPR